MSLPSNVPSDSSNPSTSADLYQEAIQLALMAVTFDSQNLLSPALFYYQECVKCLMDAKMTQQKNKQKGEEDKQPVIDAKIEEYSIRAKQIQEKIDMISKNDLESPSKSTPNDDQSSLSKLHRAEFLMKEALDFDEDEDDDEEAIELYSQAIELCIAAKEEAKDEGLKKKLTNLAVNGLERAEALKKRMQSSSNVNKKTKDSELQDLQDLDTNLENMTLGGNCSFEDFELNPVGASSGSAGTASSKPALVISGNSSYTKEEIAVLRRTSLINNREYVPFLNVDLRERFSYSIPFSDKDGLLTLSPKQKQNFTRWLRLEELSPNPKVICEIDCFSIKQTIVSDCSFVASLAVSALYEKRFQKKIITSIIYPQNRAKEPVYNPCGKYMVKLNINGISRKIIIDDLLPTGHYNELLCSYSANKNEFWVSLLEKAYMKVMGGYDFPGSNSNIDLHALTGWIPERISLKDRREDKIKLFNMMKERYYKGDVLITFATGEMSDPDCERTGLVSTHAYAMLDLKTVQGNSLFLLKNPWSHVRWKGKFSERDISSWTSSMKAALNYDPSSAKNFDNGVFWIDIDSLFHFYDVAYLNWNPGLFKYTYCTHSSWSAGVGPVKDLYNIGENPQYSLTLKTPDSSCWILLTRHITDKNDFANNREYIALLVYKTNGEKVYLPFDPPPFIDGVRINSPHYLVKIIPKDAITRYTLVISQYEKSNTINYSLRVYSTCPFNLKKLENIYRFTEKEKNGRWTAETAGGCGNNRETYHLNPCYSFTINGSTNERDNHVLIDLKGPKDYAIGIDVVTVSLDNQASEFYFKKTHSGNFRSGFTILKLSNVPNGTYNVIPSTFKAGQVGPFFLTIHSTCPIKLARIR